MLESRTKADKSIKVRIRKGKSMESFFEWVWTGYLDDGGVDKERHVGAVGEAVLIRFFRIFTSRVVDGKRHALGKL